MAENKDYKLNDILALVESEADKYALTMEQRGKALDVVRLMHKKNLGIQEVVADCQTETGEIDGPKLYNKIFGAPAKGEVRAAANPYSLYFRFNNMDDYSYVISNAYKKHRELEPDDYVFAKKMGGAKLEKLANKKIKDVVIVESPIFFNRDDYSEEILTHERQHVVNGFIHEFHLPDFEHGLGKYKELQKQGKLSSEGEAEFFRLAVDNPKIESRIKDEICAYFKDGSQPKYISKSLLRRGTIYDYALDYNYDLQDGDDVDLPVEYMEIVEDGIIAFSELLKHGYSLDEAISILYSEPLLKWPKVLERMVGEVSAKAEWEKKREKYISKIVARDKENIKNEEVD